MEYFSLLLLLFSCLVERKRFEVVFIQVRGTLVLSAGFLLALVFDSFCARI